mmetsp:Transcript_44133/g.105104  ORF Transcript_44133/g.105104 Transcript_44133/m.105104 type:complete len:228 (+) Transcript_44133:807-1490(+)
MEDLYRRERESEALGDHDDPPGVPQRDGARRPMQHPGGYRTPDQMGSGESDRVEVPRLLEVQQQLVHERLERMRVLGMQERPQKVRFQPLGTHPRPHRAHRPARVQDLSRTQLQRNQPQRGRPLERVPRLLHLASCPLLRRLALPFDHQKRGRQQLGFGPPRPQRFGSQARADDAFAGHDSVKLRPEIGDAPPSGALLRGSGRCLIFIRGILFFFSVMARKITTQLL